MKLETIFSVDQATCPWALYRLFQLLAPSAVRADDIRIEAWTGETLKRLQIGLLVALCRACDLKRSKLGRLGTYGYVVLRKYEPEDIAASELLFVHGLSNRSIACEEKRDEGGRLILTASQFQRLHGFGEVRHRIVMSNEMRQALEDAGFAELGLRETRVQHSSTPDGGIHGACWELKSGLILPKVANTDRLMCYGHDKPESFVGDYSRMVFIDDHLYSVGEIRYRRQELLALGHFDIAETFENLYIPHRSFVISQRLHQFFLEHQTPLFVEPVRID